MTLIYKSKGKPLSVERCRDNEVYKKAFWQAIRFLLVYVAYFRSAVVEIMIIKKKTTYKKLTNEYVRN